MNKYDTFEPWNAKSEYRECFKSIDDEAWISPAEAEQVLMSFGAATPFSSHRAFLAWKAEMGSLATMAGEVYETSGESTTIYVNVPLHSEWSLEEWKVDFASLWTNGTMRMTRSYAGEKQARDFLEIAFERDEVTILAQMFASVEPSEVKTDHRGQWTEEQMDAAILGCRYSSREDAWKFHFKPIQHLHGWKARMFLARWSTARKTQGRVGRPPKTRA